MTRNIDQEIDETFLKKRVQDAWEYRKKVTDTSSCRLIFGEAYFLPGLVVDKFSDVLVVQSAGTRHRQNENDDHPPVGGGSGRRTVLRSAVCLSEAMQKCVSRRAWSV